MLIMQTLKRLTLLDAKKVQAERIGKKAQQAILGGYGDGDGGVWCRVFSEGCHCGTVYGDIKYYGDAPCNVVAAAIFGGSIYDYCCQCGIEPDWK